MSHDEKQKPAQAKEDCPECCCVLGICCDRAAAMEAYIAKCTADLGCSRAEAEAHYKWTLTHFALAPKSFEAVIAEIAQMAREHFEQK